MAVTKVKQKVEERRTSVQIKPYVNKERDTLGLAVLGLSTFPNTKKSIHVPVVGNRYLTNLDEDATHLINLKRKDAKAYDLEINRIRKDIEYLSEFFPGYDLKDHSLSNPFWNEVVDEIVISSKGEVFDRNEPLSFIKYNIIKIASELISNFPIASSLEQIKLSGGRNHLFYIADEENDVLVEVNKKKLINRATQMLNTIDEGDNKRFELVFRHLTKAFRTSFRKDRKYAILDDYIKGIVNGAKTIGIEKACSEFVSACNMDIDELEKRVYMKYAIYADIIRQRADKEYYYPATSQDLGKTEEDVLVNLMSVKNAGMYVDIRDEVDNKFKIY